MKEKTLRLDKKKVTAVRRSLTVLVLILSLRKLRGFLLYGFPEEKNCVHCLLCLIVVLVILLVKDPNNASLNVPIGKFYNVNKSCQVIVGNPPIV